MSRTRVDWWAWRSRGSVEAHQDALRAVFADACYPVHLKPRKSGFLGYKASAQIMVGDLEAGVHAWGGEHQRGWSLTSVTGEGCAWIDDWSRAQEAAASCDAYEPRRVDIALDTFDGSSDFAKTLAAYRSGGFSPAGSGRPPKCEPMQPEREEDSAIIRIGSRTSDKYFRGYEKGKQQLGPAITAAAKRDPEGFEWMDFLGAHESRVIDGRLVAVSLWHWWRLELELKAQSGQLPEDVIDRRDQYFAGAYPYLGQVLGEVDAEPLIRPRERSAQLELSCALEAIRAQYGSTLFTALAAHNGDYLAVWDRIVGKSHNQRLQRAGVLMVDHA